MRNLHAIMRQLLAGHVVLEPFLQLPLAVQEHFVAGLRGTVLEIRLPASASLPNPAPLRLAFTGFYTSPAGQLFVQFSRADGARYELKDRQIAAARLVAPRS